MRSYLPERADDVLLIDRTLHMLQDEAERTTVFVRLFGAVFHRAVGSSSATSRPTWRRLSTRTTWETNRTDTGGLLAARAD